MSYPTLEQYNEALQHPHLVLIDPELKSGAVATTGLGLPLALCGGFALTYTVNTGSKKYAVRCFHKQSNALEKRYLSITNKLKAINSHYFLNFEFQPQGIRVGGKPFPVVKMAWASGSTLGEFLEGNYRNKNSLQLLNSSLRSLATFLEGNQIAHGDIQPGNVTVSGGGQSIQLIDYDGMFVGELASLGSAELGHRNFQHPNRTKDSWDYKLDRFSFISLNLAIRALEAKPELWNKTQSDGDTILFKANDFAEPAQSEIFRELFNKPQFSQDAKNLASIAKSSFNKIPSLEDFIAGRNIPQAVIAVATTTTSTPHRYISAYPVVDAMSYSVCLKYVGDRVELIGRIVEVKPGKSRYGKPYLFINFGPWQGEIVKISIWSEGLSALTQSPNQSWVGKWISVVGLVEPPYRSKRYKYSHLSISITQANQLRTITDAEAKFRLAGKAVTTTRSTNKEILDGIQGHTKISPRRTVKAPPLATPNQKVLENIKAKQPSTSRPTSRPTYTSTPQPRKKPTPSTQKSDSKGCLWLVIVIIALWLLFVKK